MAAEGNKRDSDTAEATPQRQAETQLKIVRDDANLQIICANATKVTEEREAIAVLFGMSRSSQEGEKEINVQATDRIVLSPISAKRLSILIRNELQNFDPEVGKSNVDTGIEAEYVAGNATTPDRHQYAVSWDETRVTSTYANITEVKVSREAIDILFGVEQVRQAKQNEVRVEFARHVALSPTVAHRLAIDLGDAVRNHETRRGAKEPGSDAASEPQVQSRNNRDASGKQSVGKILSLFRQLGTLNARIDLEYSFKAVHSNFFVNRLLFAVDRRDTEDRDERITLICEGIGMPRNLLASFVQQLRDANHVYFGAERTEHTLLFKAYLEFRDKIEKEIEGGGATGRSFPLFTGYKWDTSAPQRQAVTQYAWHPSLTVSDMLTRLQSIMDPSRHQGLLEIATGITKRAEEEISHSDIQYLEVTEEGNPRRSFDINIYKSGLRLADICPYLLRALQYYAIPSSRFESLYQRVKNERFGHLAGGVDRENNDFMTVYYGVTQMHSHQLGSATIA